MGVGGAHGVQLRRPPQSPFQLRYPFQRLNHNIKLRNCLRSSKGGTVPSPSEDPVVPVVGIDLGTTNSAIAWMEGGKPRCIPGPDGSRIVPSVVHFAADGSVVVGKDARRLLAANPRTTFYSVKRVIGRSWDDPVVQEEAKRVSYEVSKDEEGATTLTCPSVDKGYVYPEEVGAMVLAQLLDHAEAAAATGDGQRVTKAVISVPAYFSRQQRDATAAAGRLAGLETVRLLREPVAAALAYGLDLREDRTVLVFDLGGGTYDISILEVGNGTVEVLSTGGDAHLGGDDWDAVIIDWLKSEYLRPAGVDVNGDPALLARLKGLAEAAKMQLSSSEEVTLRMPVAGGIDATLSRQKFEALCDPLWRRARLPLDAACWQAGVDLYSVLSEAETKRQELAKRGVPEWKQEALTKPQIRPKKRGAIGKILLVGGATRMPAVQRFVSNMTGLAPEWDDAVPPDEAVALGAAVQAGILQGEVEGLMVMDNWQASLMRAMAVLTLKQQPGAREALGQKFDMSDMAGGEFDDDDGDEGLMEEDDESGSDAEQAAAAVRSPSAASTSSRGGSAGSAQPPHYSQPSAARPALKSAVPPTAAAAAAAAAGDGSNATSVPLPKPPSRKMRRQAAAAAQAAHQQDASASDASTM